MEENDRRIHERTPCPDSWTDVSIVNRVQEAVQCATLEVIKVRIDNISISGACVISEKPFELDQLLRFHGEIIKKTGRVVWTCQSKIECRAGIHFEDFDI